MADRSHTDPYHFAGNVFGQSVLSALDVACWDTVGRTVHRLLGGRKCETLTPYASTMYFTEEERPIAEPIEEAVEEAVAAGFTAAKIKVGSGFDEDRERVRVAREGFGDDGTLMVDRNGNYRPRQAIKTAKAIEQYDVAWIEEPAERRRIPEFY